MYLLFTPGATRSLPLLFWNVFRCPFVPFRSGTVCFPFGIAAAAHRSKETILISVATEWKKPELRSPCGMLHVNSVSLRPRSS